MRIAKRRKSRAQGEKKERETFISSSSPPFSAALPAAAVSRASGGIFKFCHVQV